MIFKIHKSRPEFKSILQYAGDKKNEKGEPVAEIIGGNVPALFTGDLIKSFKKYETLNKRVKNPLLHMSVSLAENETLHEDQWQILGEAILKSQGLDPKKHAYTIIRHNDTDHEHVHIIASRIDYNGRVGRVFGKQYVDKKTGKTKLTRVDNVENGAKICREYEKIFGLKNPNTDANPKSKTNKREKQINKKRGEPENQKEIIQDVIDEITTKNVFNLNTKDGQNFFQTELHKKGIEVFFTCQGENQRLTGMAFRIETSQTKYSGTKLGADYKAAKLIRRALHVDERLQKNQEIWENYHQQRKESWEKIVKEIEKSQKEIEQALKIKKEKIKELQDTNEIAWIFHKAAMQAKTTIEKIAAALWEIYFAMCAIDKMNQIQNEKEKIHDQNETKKEKIAERKEKLQALKEKTKETSKTITSGIGKYMRNFFKPKTTAKDETPQESNRPQNVPTPQTESTASQKTAMPPLIFDEQKTKENKEIEREIEVKVISQPAVETPKQPEPLVKIDLDFLNFQVQKEKEKEQMRQQQPTEQARKGRGR